MFCTCWVLFSYTEFTSSEILPYKFQGSMYICTKVHFLVTKTYIDPFQFIYVSVHSFHLSSSKTHEWAERSQNAIRIVVGVGKTCRNVWWKKCHANFPFHLFPCSPFTLVFPLVSPFTSSFAMRFRTHQTWVQLAVTKATEIMLVGLLHVSLLIIKINTDWNLGVNKYVKCPNFI